MAGRKTFHHSAVKSPLVRAGRFGQKGAEGKRPPLPFGRSDWIRTSAALPSRIVERGSRHSRVSRSPCFVGYRFVKTAHRAVFARSPLVPCSGPIRRWFEPGASGKQRAGTNVPALCLVGVTGFEPAASWSRTKRSTKLSHTPVFFFRREYYNTEKGVCQAQSAQKQKGKNKPFRKRRPLCPFTEAKGSFSVPFLKPRRGGL